MEIVAIKNKGYIELKDILKMTGLCPTGGEAKIVIAEGLVRVDGLVEKRTRCKIRSGQIVEFEGRKIQAQEE